MPHQHRGVPTGAQRSVLIIDDSEPFRDALGCSFRACGFEVWLSDDFLPGQLIAEQNGVDLVVMELQLAGKSAFSLLQVFRPRESGTRVCIVTAHASVSSALHAARSGFDGYLAKPVTAPLVLQALGEEPSPGPEEAPFVHPPSPGLDRAIWDYLNLVFLTSGSMSEAARRLGLDRRSLRRMLKKPPPGAPPLPARGW
jgi:two-component system response regulator RegA